MKKVMTTKTTNLLELNADDLAEALRAAGYDVDPMAKIFVRVPGGGNWSDMELEIGRDSNLLILTEKTETDEA